MIKLPGATAFLSKLPIIPGEAFHAECELLPGLSPFLKGRACVRVGDGGPDLEIFVNPDELPTRNGRRYVQLLVDSMNRPKQPDEFILCGLWSAVDHTVRDQVPGIWIALKKLVDPFPPIVRDEPNL